MGNSKTGYKPKSLEELMGQVDVAPATPPAAQTNIAFPPEDTSERKMFRAHRMKSLKPLWIVWFPYRDRQGNPQKFDPYSEEEMTSLVQSIQAVGIHTPIIVKPLDDGTYMILAGHNRCEGAKRAGLETVPAIIREVSDEVAEFIVLSTNLDQRMEHKPSVLATTCQRYLELARELTSDGTRGNAGNAVAEKLGFSRRQVYRYIQLAALNKALLGYVDSEVIPVTVAIALTKLEAENQELLAIFITTQEILQVTAKQAKLLLESACDEVSLQEIFGFIKRVAPPPAVAVGKKSKQVLNDYFTERGLALTDGELAEKLLEIFSSMSVES